MGSEVRLNSPLPDGSRPAPAPPPKRLRLAPSDIERVRVVEQGNREIRFERVAPLELPPLPEPTPPVDAGTESFPDSDPDPVETRWLFVGATTYTLEGRPEEARTAVRVWPQGGGEPAAFWAGANFLWLTGFASFEAGGVNHNLMLAVSETKLRSWEELAQLEHGGTPAPEGLEAGQLHQTGGAADAGLTEPIQQLMELYRQEKQRLRAAHEARVAAAEARAEELRLNPPDEKTLILRHWRTDRPSAEPRPADIR